MCFGRFFATRDILYIKLNSYILVILSFGLFSLGLQAKVTNGELNLKESFFQSDETIDLDGNRKFYWQNFIDPIEQKTVFLKTNAGVDLTFFEAEATGLKALGEANHLCDESGKPVLIDPSVYYGHREMDLPMMRLFGGYESETFRAYQESFLLEPGFEQRLGIHQLYPLLVHLNLFGSSYLASCQQCGRLLPKLLG